MPTDALRDAISDQLVARLSVIPSPEWLDETVNAIATAVELQTDPWDPACCRREREACAQLAQDEEERGWGRKGFHRVADAIRGRGEWVAHLSAEAKRARADDGVAKEVGNE